VGNYHPILIQIGTQTKKNMLSLKVTIPKSQSSFKMAAAAILEIEERAMQLPPEMQIGTQTNKSILSLKISVPEVTIKFQDGRRRHIGN
jgi:hypothetical protein